jgi:hypothetical protein
MISQLSQILRGIFPQFLQLELVLKGFLYSARDICHYGRGSLIATTIQDLMMIMCTSRSNIKTNRLYLLKKHLSRKELQIADEEPDAQVR